MLTNAAYEAARLLRVPALLRRWSDGAALLCYHNVVPHGAQAGRDAALHMDLDVFEHQLRWLRQHLDLVRLDTLVERISAGASLRGLGCVTFDDGYGGFFRCALPLLRSLGVPSAVFLVADAADHPAPFWWDHPALAARATPERRARWLVDAQGDAAAILRMEGAAPDADAPPDLLPASWEVIQSHVGPDLTIGAHTCTHRALPTLSPSDLQDELARAAARIGARTGARPRFLAYPYGAWNAAVRDAAAAAGYDAALTLDAGLVRRRHPDMLALRRINVPGRIPAAAFEAWVSGLLPPARRR